MDLQELAVEEAKRSGRGTHWPPRHPSGLSAREMQVACMLATGSSNREIAAHLGLSIKTIDTHRGHALKILGLRNNVDLARRALREGWVSLSEGT